MQITGWIFKVNTQFSWRATLGLFLLTPLVLGMFSACTKKKATESTIMEELGPSRTTVTKPATLDAWLDANTNIRDAIKLEQAPTSTAYLHGGANTDLAWSSWSESDKQALRDAFDRAWEWLYLKVDHLNSLGTDEFSSPIPCASCETSLSSNPTGNAVTIVTVADAKKVYFSHVAHQLAAEIGGALGWSILAESSTLLHHYFNSRSIMQYYNATGVLLGQPNFVVDAREKYIARSSPATARWTYAWLEKNDLIKSTRAETIEAFLQWGRENLIHFYGAASYAGMDDHWLYPSIPSVQRVLEGTVSRSYGQNHWTAGCHGTIGLIKQVLRTALIPVEPLFVCGHSQAYFPTEGKYMDHGDNLYSSTVTGSSRNIMDVLIDATKHASWFSATPDFLSASDPLCSNIGRAATEF